MNSVNCINITFKAILRIIIFFKADFFSIRKNDIIIYFAKIELNHSFHNRTDVVFLYPVYGMPLSAIFTNML